MAASTCGLEQWVRKVLLDKGWTIQDILWNHTVPVDHNMIQVMSLISMQDNSQRSIQHYPLIYTQFPSGITQIIQDTSGFSIRAMYSTYRFVEGQGWTNFPKILESSHNTGAIRVIWSKLGPEDPKILDVAVQNLVAWYMWVTDAEMKFINFKCPVLRS
jgi:hypothetical protein